MPKAVARRRPLGVYGYSDQKTWYVSSWLVDVLAVDAPRRLAICVVPYPVCIDQWVLPCSSLALHQLYKMTSPLVTGPGVNAVNHEAEPGSIAFKHRIRRVCLVTSQVFAALHVLV